MEPCVNLRRERAFQLSRALSPQKKKDERAIKCRRFGQNFRSLTVSLKQGRSLMYLVMRFSASRHLPSLSLPPSLRAKTLWQLLRF
jgi:hypothetical protein